MNKQVVIHGGKNGKFNYKCERLTVGGYYELLHGSKQGYNSKRDARRGFYAAADFFNGYTEHIHIVHMTHDEYIKHRAAQAVKKRRALKR